METFSFCGIHTVQFEVGDRLCQCLNQNKDTTPEVLLQRVKGDVDLFVGDAPQFDDITMLCLEYKEQCKKEGEA